MKARYNFEKGRMTLSDIDIKEELVIQSALKGLIMDYEDEKDFFGSLSPYRQTELDTAKRLHEGIRQAVID